jgi:predicted metal-dependent phosphotriesterase family hydrolase
LGPVFFPAQRRFVQRTVEGHPGEVQPNQVVVVLQGFVPEVGKNAGLHPLLEAAMGRRALAQTRRVQGFPLATRAQHKENGVQYVSVGNAPSVPTQRVRFGHVHGQQRRKPRP